MNISDSELIYLYKETNNLVAFNLLKEKYFFMLNALVHKMYWSKNNNLFSIDDLKSCFEEEFHNVIKEYHYKPTIDYYPLKSFLFISIRRKISSYLKKQNNRKFKFLNNCISIDLIDSESINDKTCEFSISPEKLFKNKLKEKSEKFRYDWIMKNINKILNKNELGMFYDRLNGYTWTDLSDKNNIKVGKARYIFKKIKSKIIKEFEEENKISWNY